MIPGSPFPCVTLRLYYGVPPSCITQSNIPSCPIPSCPMPVYSWVHFPNTQPSFACLPRMPQSHIAALTNIPNAFQAENEIKQKKEKEEELALHIQLWKNTIKNKNRTKEMELQKEEYTLNNKLHKAFLCYLNTIDVQDRWNFLQQFRTKNY